MVRLHNEYKCQRLSLSGREKGGRLRTASSLSFGIFLLTIFVIGAIAGCTSNSANGGNGGNNGGSGATAAPSSLSYAQASITATVGQAITVDAPSVNGTVTSYSVSPALPAGLSLSTTTGVISGTPTATAAKASYTVTASNSGGSTTATVQITVNPTPPSTLTYAQGTIAASIGVAITPDTPTVTGVVDSYSVSRDLPAGLSIDAKTGVISGTPTATAAQANYTVTAANAGGSATANITIAVSPKTLLELGQAGGIGDLAFANGRVLEGDVIFPQDTTSNSMVGHWALYDYATAKLIADGNATEGYSFGTAGSQKVSPIVAMGGSTIAVSIMDGVELRSATDGHLLSTVSYPLLNEFDSTRSSDPWWRLAIDGSYLVIGSDKGLFIYSPAGDLISSRTGTYLGRAVYAAPGQVQMPDSGGNNTIETVSVKDGSSSVSPAFIGTFDGWLSDGRFLSQQANDVFVYSAAAVQQGIVAGPSGHAIGAVGNWVWDLRYDSTVKGDVLDVYAVGATTPTFTHTVGLDNGYVASGNLVAIFIPTGVEVLDLSGNTPTTTDYALPTGSASQFAANPPSAWVVAADATLMDGASLGGTPRFFGNGAAWSIAGSQKNVAIGLERGQIQVWDPAQQTLENNLAQWGAQVRLSTDGSVLGAATPGNDYQWHVYPTMTPEMVFYSLPSESVISTFLYPGPASGDSGYHPETFTLSGSGGVIGRHAQGTRTVSDITGSTVYWSDTAGAPSWMRSSEATGITSVPLSPDGTLSAGSSAGSSGSPVTNIYKGGKLVAAVQGLAVAWLDNNRLLVNQYTADPANTPKPFTGAVIVDATGAQVATSPIPEMFGLQPVTSDTVYDAASNAIYSLSTGKATWTGSAYSRGVGAVAGPYVVYESLHSVVMETY